MKRRIIGFVKVIAFAALLCVTLVFLNNLLREKWHKNVTMRDEEFKTLKRDSIEALFIGSSRSYYAVSPSVIMDETGVSSFVLGIPSMRLNMVCEMLRHALKTQSPEVVFVEAYSLTYGIPQTTAYMHYAFDGWAPSWDKWQAICRVTTQEDIRRELMIPLIVYHNRWKELEADDWRFALGRKKYNIVKGQLVSPNIAQDVVLDGSMFSERNGANYTVTQENKKAFEDIRRLCEERGIRLVLWAATSPGWSPRVSEFVSEYAQEEGIPFYDYNIPQMVEQMGIDTDSDFADVGHLNVCGAKKNSLALCSALNELGIKGHELTQEEKGLWDECRKNYEAVYRRCERIYKQLQEGT